VELRDAIRKDLDALGPLAERAFDYVSTGEDEAVLEDVKGVKGFHLSSAGGWSSRPYFSQFGDGDEAMLERLGRLFHAVSKKGFIEELAGDLRWVEQVLWESGGNAPSTLGQMKGYLRLELVERRMKDAAPLVRAMLVATRDGHGFHRHSFAHNACGSPDAAAFFVRNKDAVAAILREGHAEALDRFEKTSTPVAPFADVLADLAVDSRVTVRRAVMKILAHDPAAARAALRSIAEDEARKTKEIGLAQRALEMLDTNDAIAPVGEIAPLTEDAKTKLRALCDEWLAQATPRFHAHKAKYPAAPDDWIAPIDEALFEKACALVSDPEPWKEETMGVLAGVTRWSVAMEDDRISELLADDAFTSIQAARIEALASQNDWRVLARILETLHRKKCLLADVAIAIAASGRDPGILHKELLDDGTSFGDDVDAAYLNAHQDILEVALGARAATWFDPRSYWADHMRKRAFNHVLVAMDPASVKNGVREALWELALRGGKGDRPHAQACVAKLGDYETRLVAALASGVADERANAAAWIARAKLDARPALRKALAKEKNDAARVAIMEALEAAGEPLDALMNRASLADAAKKTLAKVSSPVLRWADTKKLPKLHWADTKAPIEDEIAHAWIAETWKAKSPVPSPLLRLYARTIATKDREAFALGLLDAWFAHDGSDAKHSAIGEKGVLAIVAAFGGHDVAPRVAAYLKEWYGMRAAQCKALLQMLAYIDDKNATQLLLATATRFRTAGIRAEAEIQAKTLAERRGWTVDEMADRTIPAGGLEDDGTFEIAYGEKGRKFVARLDPALRVALFHEGNAIKSLPAAHKGEKEDDVKAAKSAFSKSKKEIETVVKMQRTRLYEAMCTQRTWRFEDWTTLLGKHPIVRHLVTGVVWVEQTGAEETSFRPLGDGTLSTAKHRDVKPAPDAIVRVAHPLTLHDSHVTDWTEHLGDFEILPLFPQFGRATHVVAEAERKEKECSDFVGHMVEAFKLRGRADALGYVRGQTEDGGWFYRYTKIFPSLGLQAIVNFSGNEMPEENRTVALGTIAFERTGDDERGSVTLGAIPPVLFSEVWNDVQDIARTGTGFDPAWESKVR
jgi:hypothetical protein